jgi:predicted esterase
MNEQSSVSQIREHSVAVRRRARYYTSGTVGKETREIWIVLHGYGQLARYFLRNFSPLFSHERAFLAPEGLSRFYLGDDYSRVGASWLTKEGRELELADQAEYFETILQACLPDDLPNGCRVVVFGFSQGATAAWRLAAQSVRQASDLILWAGLPPQTDDGAAAKSIPVPANRLWVALAPDDPYITQERTLAMEASLARLTITAQTHPYAGGHRIPSEALLSLVEQLRLPELA